MYIIVLFNTKQLKITSKYVVNVFDVFYYVTKHVEKYERNNFEVLTKFYIYNKYFLKNTFSRDNENVYCRS